MKNPTRSLSGILLMLALALGFALAPEAEARRERVRLTTLAPKDSSFHKSLIRMGQDWKKAADGDVDLIVFAGGIQGGETAMIDRMRVNQTQAALITGVGLAEIDEAVAGLQQVPMLFRSFEEVDYVLERIGPTLEKRLRDKGFVLLSWMDTGWVRIFSKFPISTPDDMRKGKLYTWSGDNEQTDLLKKLGFRPVPIDSTEIVSSLQTGLVDIVPLPPFFALAAQTYNPAPHMLDINYVPLIGAIVVSERAWERIDPELQKEMKEIAQRHGREMTEAGRQESEQAVRVMEEKWALKVKDPEGQTLQAWQDISQQAYGMIRDNTVPAEIFDEVLRLLDEYRSQD